MKILFFGDIYGKLGRQVLQKVLPRYIKVFHPDFVIANCENMAHGSGINEKYLKTLVDTGVDAFTNGNHAFHTPESKKIFATSGLPIIRPANFSDQLPGCGYLILEKGKKQLCITNLIGRVFMPDLVDDPLLKADSLVDKAAKLGIRHIFLDFHAEATGEKIGLGHYLDGRVSCVIGTHTHVQTTDERILASGTAFISDAGFCGALDSVIGAEKESAIKRLLTGINPPLKVMETGPVVISGVIIELKANGKAKKIERIYEIANV